VPEERFREGDRALEERVENLQSSFEGALRWIQKLTSARDAEAVDAVVGHE
jgi:hypothetical protein